MSVSSKLVEADDPRWAALLAAFWRYERALVANDVAVLDALFRDSDDTIRADGSHVLVGYGEIRAFRAGRTPPPARVVQRVHLRPAGEDCAVVVAETLRADGGRGVQTQVWRDSADGWQVDVAHVAVLPAQAPPVPIPAETGAVWRVILDAAPERRDGPLAGIGIAVKDLFALAGQQIGAGNPHWLEGAPTERRTAAALDRLVAAGAHVVGIARTDELAFSLAGINPHYGTPPNAAAPGRITGGSTSGPAAAVAAGAAELGLGTDTAGSIRVPASYCGLFGWRPTHGSVPVDGVLALAPSFDTVGLLASDATVLWSAALAVLGRAEPAAAPRPVDEVVVAEDLLRLVEEPMRIAFTAGLRGLLGRTGTRVRTERQLCRGELEAWFSAFRLVQAHEAWDEYGEFVAAHPGSLDPATEARFRSGAAVGADEARRAYAVLEQARGHLDAALPPGSVLALPATSSPAPAIGLDADSVQRVRDATLRLTCLASATGRPAVVLPTLRVGTVPAGLCLVGARGADLDLLDLARRTGAAVPESPDRGGRT